MVSASLFRLLGDEARLRILGLLARERLNVSELTSILGIAQPAQRDPLLPLLQALDLPPHLPGPEGELEAVCYGDGVLPVGPPHAHRGLVPLGQVQEDALYLMEVPQDDD